MPPRSVSERRLIFLLASVQFVNVLDFMMVMPLGPDFAVALGIPMSQLGWIGGSYTGAAAIAGLIGAGILDRFDRRAVLVLGMLGLAIGTAAGGFATDLKTLMAARIVAGCFGGPATSVSLAILADQVPPERRGRAMGSVLGAFSVAAVLGVPLGLELARIGSWRLPFFAVAGLAALGALFTLVFLPPQRGHLGGARTGPARRPIGAFVKDPAVLTALSAVALTTAGAFLVIPHISAYFQHNLGYPREHLGVLYMVGGAVSFAAMRLGGRWVDKYGATRVAILGSGLMALDLLLGFSVAPPLLPPLVIFTGFMLASALRSIASSSLTTRVPEAGERARFMSSQAAVQHAASSTGAIVSSLLLGELATGALTGMSRVAWLSLGIALPIPLLVIRLSRAVRRREAQQDPWVAMASPPK